MRYAIARPLLCQFNCSPAPPWGISLVTGAYHGTVHGSRKLPEHAHLRGRGLLNGAQRRTTGRMCPPQSRGLATHLLAQSPASTSPVVCLRPAQKVHSRTKGRRVSHPPRHAPGPAYVSSSVRCYSRGRPQFEFQIEFRWPFSYKTVVWQITVLGQLINYFSFTKSLASCGRGMHVHPNSR